MVDQGKLVVVTGPMFAGKTTFLIKEIEEERSYGKKVIMLKSRIDNRYSESDVVSHDGLKVQALILPEGEECIPALKRIAEQYDVIIIDEGHFWEETKGFASALDDLAYHSKKVYVSLLNKDQAGRAFRVASELLPLADSVYSLVSKCAKCGGEATYSQRMVKDSSKFVVGGAGAYEPRCRRCFEPWKPE